MAREDAAEYERLHKRYLDMKRQANLAETHGADDGAETLRQQAREAKAESKRALLRLTGHTPK